MYFKCWLERGLGLRKLLRFFLKRFGARYKTTWNKLQTRFKFKKGKVVDCKTSSFTTTDLPGLTLLPYPDIGAKLGASHNARSAGTPMRLSRHVLAEMVHSKYDRICELLIAKDRLST